MKAYYYIILLIIIFQVSCTSKSERGYIITYGGDAKEFLYLFEGYCEEDYNSHNLLQKVICYENDSKEKIKGITEYLYNQNDSLIEIKQYTSVLGADTSRYVRKGRNYFQCDNNINNDRMFLFDINMNLIKVQDSDSNYVYHNFKKYKYDKQGRVIAKVEYIVDAGILLTKEYYKYDEERVGSKGNWTKRFVYSTKEEFHDELEGKLEKMSIDERQKIFSFLDSPIDNVEPQVFTRTIVYN